MTWAISAHPNSHISYDSEFLLLIILASLLYLSPLWDKINSSLSKGEKYPLARISNARRCTDLEEAIVRVNHTAKLDTSNLKNTLFKEALLVFQLHVIVNAVQKTPYTCVAPYGLIYQLSVDETSKIMIKHRVVQGQSLQFSPKNSVNDRVKIDALIKLIYRYTLQQIVHYTHCLRFHHPTKSILVSKYTFTSAYRRITLGGHSAAASFLSSATVFSSPYASPSVIHSAPFSGAQSPRQSLI